MIQVARYDELSVKGLYSQFMTLHGVADFFPSKYPKGRVCDRDYMFNVTNSLHPDVVKEIVEYANAQRNDVKSEA